MGQSKSTSLFHFTKDIEVLKSILTHGFYPRFHLEDTSWQEIDALELVAFPMICFCDIPIARISEHIDFYGHYGLGMSKDWALINGLNPIFYLSPKSPIARSFADALLKGYRFDREEKDKEMQIFQDLKFISAHSKPTSGKCVHNDSSTTEKDFYLENEWRYVPMKDIVPVAITKKEYEDTQKREEYNNLLAKEAFLEFTPNDIRYIFVESDTDIPFLVDFINSELSKLSFSEINILTTRITSLEHIQKDI